MDSSSVGRFPRFELQRIGMAQYAPSEKQTVFMVRSRM